MSARAIEIHNGYVTFAERGVGITLKADRPAIDIDASPEEGSTVLGTMSILRIRGNVQHTDLVGGELRVLNIQARPAKNIGTIDGINLECEAKDGADISNFRMIRGKMEIPLAGGTVAKIVGLDIAFALDAAPTYGAGIALYNQRAQVLDYGIDFTNVGTNSLNPDKAEWRMSHDVCIMVGSGNPSNGTSGTGAGYAGPGSLYIDYTASSADGLWGNEGTKASPTWANIGST